jgi:hypothetical protein
MSDHVHAWNEEPLTPGQIRAYRNCDVCGLQDSKLLQSKHPQHPGTQWQVTTPCIEPIPETITWEEFKADLAANGFEHRGVASNQYRSLPFVYAEGNPDDWRVGIEWHDSSIAIRREPTFNIKAPETLERGYALVLQWLRARHYHPRKYPSYQSTGMKTVLIDRDCGDDDEWD